MLELALVAATCSFAATAAAVVFVGRTVHSSPYGNGIKVTPDPGNVRSWHHEFANTGSGISLPVDVLVDVDGNGVMDTEHEWLRVIVTDIELVSAAGRGERTVRPQATLRLRLAR